MKKINFLLPNGEKPLFKMSLRLDASKTPDQYETEITNLGYNISNRAKYILYKMPPLKNNEDIDIVSFTVAQLGFTSNTEYSKITERALQLGLQKCPPQVGPELRIYFIDQPQNSYYCIAMDAISDPGGEPVLFHVDRHDVGDWLFSNNGREVARYSLDNQFVFCVSKSLSPLKLKTE